MNIFFNGHVVHLESPHRQISQDTMRVGRRSGRRAEFESTQVWRMLSEMTTSLTACSRNAESGSDIQMVGQRIEVQLSNQCTNVRVSIVAETIDVRRHRLEAQAYHTLDSGRRLRGS